MESIQPIIDFISNNGFAIVMSILLLRENSIRDKQYKDLFTTMNETLNANTLTIQKLIDKLEGKI